ncbi:hypothetical protein ABZ766_22600 [Streptomyces sp. NPDC006670]|uniref:hypothetical protein n=1 Tax=Streptomyces sp. NPDC006670 TaxID=3154476 RepID=UPI003409FB7F
MTRTRTAALTVVAAVAALTPVLGQAAATAADGKGEGKGNLPQDPVGSGKAWSEDQKHKVEGEARFHPGVQYQTVTRPGPEGAPEWERKVGDPKTLAWLPSYEFAWTVSDVLVNKGLTTKNGKHALTLHAVLRDARHTAVAQVHKELSGQAATGRQKVAGNKRIACDTGDYTVEWTIERPGYAKVGGTLRWNSSCEQYRTAFAAERAGK